MKNETFDVLVKDEVLDSNDVMEYLLEKFKMILLTSWSTESIKNLKRLFNIIIKVKETQLVKIQELSAKSILETNP